MKHTIYATADILLEDGSVAVAQGATAATVDSPLSLDKVLAGMQTGRLTTKTPAAPPANISADATKKPADASKPPDAGKGNIPAGEGAAK